MPRNVMDKKGMEQPRTTRSLASSLAISTDTDDDDDISTKEGVRSLSGYDAGSAADADLEEKQPLQDQQQEKCNNGSSILQNLHELPNNNNNNNNQSSRKKAESRFRHESTDTEESSDTSSSTLERPALDGGYGWVVVGAAFFINMIADGITFSIGVYYLEFLSYFGKSKSATAWIGSLLAAMPLLSGPIASSLADRFGCRRCTIAGSVLATLGFVLSAFANSIEMLYLTFGVITGFGLSLCYVAAAVIVAYYFDQKRSLATGLSACGGGIGTFVFAPLTQYLINEFTWPSWYFIQDHNQYPDGSKISRGENWRWTMLLMAGIFLNMSICGLLMVDLEWTKKNKNCAQNHHHKSHHTTINESNSPTSEFAPSEISIMIKNERLCNSAICIPTFVIEQEKFYNRNNILQNDFPSSSSSKLNGPIKKGSLENGSLLNPILKPPPQQTESAIHNYIINNTNSWSGAVHRHSLTYRGAIISLRRYRLRASSCPDIISVATDDNRNSHSCSGFAGDVCRWIRGVFECDHLTNSRFILFVISNFLLYMWYDIPYMMIQDASVQGGYSETLSSYLISIIGLFNMVGNIILGYVGDKSWVESTFVYGICMVLCGFMCAVIPSFISLNYYLVAIACAIFGITIAANYSLTSAILVQVVSLERFANAYGFLLLVQGVGNLLGPPLAGVIYDFTESSSWSFWVAGMGIFLSSVFILAPKVMNRRLN